MSFLATSGYTVIGFIVDITLVVFFHELGHFLVGRWCGVRVDAFSIGFGRELFAWVDRRGTRWRVAALPLGGYVKFHGDLNAASAGPAGDLARMSPAERAVSFPAQPVWKRAAIVAAGPAANFILALVLLTGLIYAQGVPSTEARIGAVLPGRPAAAAGFEPGDVVRAIDGRPIATFRAMHDAVAASAGAPLRFSLLRDGRPLELTAAPTADAAQPGPQPGFVLGVGAAMEPIPLTSAAADAGRTCWNMVATTGRYVGGLLTLREKADQISGPIGIASAAGQAARMGVGSSLFLVVILSVSIGLMNLLPVPLLDGGHLLYYALEAVRGRPLSPAVQEFGFKVGLALVALLMVFATTNDVGHGLSALLHG